MYNTLIPQHLQEELIQIGEDLTKNIFRVGDIVVAIMDFVTVNELGCTKRDVWRAVGALIGKSATTVQGYESLANFYPQSIRNKYSVLSSSHFRTAMRIDSTTEYDWKMVLDYAIDRVQDYGRPATVDELIHVFIYDLQPFEFEDEEIHSEAGSSPIDEFVNYLSQLRRTAELLPIPEQMRSELLDSIRRVEFILSSAEVQLC